MNRIALLFGLLLSVAVAQDAKIGYVNTAEVLLKFEEAKTVENKIRQLRTQYQTGLNALQREFSTLQSQYERQKIILTEDKKKELLDQIEKKRTEIAVYERTKLLNPDGELFVKVKQLRTPVIDKVLKAVEAVAKNKGFDLILDNANQVVLFAGANVDFTQDVITYLNKETQQ